MEAAGIPKIKTALFGVSIFDTKPSVVVLSEADVPKEMVQTTITTKVKKDVILQHYLDTGEIPPGVEITHGKGLRIS
jgi:hypothetical protein